MTITKAIPKLWSARLLKNFRQRNLWRDAIMDVSSELPEGNSLSLSKITTAVTVGDYTKDTDINNPQTMTDTDTVLTLSKQRYFNIAIDDIDSVQAKPDMMDGFMEEASVAIANDTNTYLQSLIPAKDNRPAAQVTSITKPSNVDAPTDAEVQAIISSFNVIRRKLVVASWPINRVTCMVSPMLAFWLNEYISDRQAGTGSVSDGALVNGRLTNLFGMRTVENPTMTITTASKDLQAVILVREAMIAAYQIAEVEPYRLEKRFSDGLKGLFVYGGLLAEPTKMHYVQIK